MTSPGGPLDGVNTSPPQTLDYERLVEATDMTVRWDTTGEGTFAEISKRVDIKALSNMASKRADETAGLWGAAPPRTQQIVQQFIHVWMEGFMFAVVYSEQAKTTALFGKLPDKNLLGATDSIIGGHWADDREAQWAKRADVKSLVHVATVRSVQAVQIKQVDRPQRPELMALQAAHWMDGFSMGLLFAELGGHREG